MKDKRIKYLWSLYWLLLVATFVTILYNKWLGIILFSIQGMVAITICKLSKGDKNGTD